MGDPLELFPPSRAFYGRPERDELGDIGGWILLFCTWFPVQVLEHEPVSLSHFELEEYCEGGMCRYRPFLPLGLAVLVQSRPCRLQKPA